MRHQPIGREKYHASTTSTVGIRLRQSRTEGQGRALHHHRNWLASHRGRARSRPIYRRPGWVIVTDRPDTYLIKGSLSVTIIRIHECNGQTGHLPMESDVCPLSVARNEGALPTRRYEIAFVGANR